MGVTEVAAEPDMTERFGIHPSTAGSPPDFG